MIPQHLHYCWFGGKRLPPLAQACVDSWARVMPGYATRRWDETNVGEFACGELQHLLAHAQWAFASDLARLLILQRYGGVYLDTDMEAVRPLDDLLAYGCFVGYEAAARISNGACGAVPRHPYTEACLDRLLARHRRHAPIEYSPETCSAVYSSQAWPDVHVCPPSAFYPYNPYDPARAVKALLYSDITPDTYLIHHWAKSWHTSLWMKARRKLYWRQ